VFHVLGLQTAGQHQGLGLRRDTENSRSKSILRNDRRFDWRVDLGVCLGIFVIFGAFVGFLSNRILDTVDQEKIPGTAAASTSMNVLSRAD
jgi:hypothetical protein